MSHEIHFVKILEKYGVHHIFYMRAQSYIGRCEVYALTLSR
jgi:hypothetical protein